MVASRSNPSRGGWLAISGAPRAGRARKRGRALDQRDEGRDHARVELAAGAGVQLLDRSAARLLAGACRLRECRLADAGGADNPRFDRDRLAREAFRPGAVVALAHPEQPVAYVLWDPGATGEPVAGLVDGLERLGFGLVSFALRLGQRRRRDVDQPDLMQHRRLAHGFALGAAEAELDRRRERVRRGPLGVLARSLGVTRQRLHQRRATSLQLRREAELGAQPAQLRGVVFRCGVG